MICKTPQRSALGTSFGRNVRRYRRLARMSQETLASLADVNRTHISQLENGSKSVGLETIGRLAQALNVAPADLVWLDPVLVQAAQEDLDERQSDAASHTSSLPASREGKNQR